MYISEITKLREKNYNLYVYKILQICLIFSEIYNLTAVLKYRNYNETLHFILFSMK